MVVKDLLVVLVVLVVDILGAVVVLIPVDASNGTADRVLVDHTHRAMVEVAAALVLYAKPI